MQIYSDDFGRVIWLTISPAEVRMDLLDHFSEESPLICKGMSKECQRNVKVKGKESPVPGCGNIKKH